MLMVDKLETNFFFFFPFSLSFPYNTVYYHELKFEVYPTVQCVCFAVQEYATRRQLEVFDQSPAQKKKTVLEDIHVTLAQDEKNVMGITFGPFCLAMKHIVPTYQKTYPL